MLMSRIKKLQLVKVFGAVLLEFIIVAPTSAEAPAKLERKLLFENSVVLESKDVDTKIIKVTFPPKFITPWHEHKGPGPRYILKGQLTVTEGGKTNTYTAGGVFWESGLKMQVENTGEGEAELIIFELVPNSKTLKE